jgi:hypothetical protein
MMTLSLDHVYKTKKCGLFKMSKVSYLIMFLFATRLLSLSNLQAITCEYK